MDILERDRKIGSIRHDGSIVLCFTEKRDLHARKLPDLVSIFRDRITLDGCACNRGAVTVARCCDQRIMYDRFRGPYECPARHLTIQILISYKGRIMPRHQKMVGEFTHYLK